MRAAAWQLALCLAALAACGRNPGRDSDHDGLYDWQERKFGTDPFNPDTDGDGLKDGDPRNWDPTGRNTRVALVASPVYGTGGTRRCSDLVARVTVANGAPPAGMDVAFTTTLGDLGQVAASNDGAFSVTLCTDQKGQAAVTASYLKHSQSVNVSFDLGLPVPGLNAGTSKGSGTIDDGFLHVSAITRGIDGSEAPFPGATVLVQGGGKSCWRQTGSQGDTIFHLGTANCPDATAPVDVTVGADGYRWTTYMGVRARNVAVRVSRLDPLPGDTSRTGRITGIVTGFGGKPDLGIAAFPDGDFLTGEFSVAIVQVASQDVPLSSMSMGSVLVPPEGPIAIPANMFLKGGGPYSLSGVPEGHHLVFALAGIADNAVGALEDPYRLTFRARALGIQRVAVAAGADNEVNIDLTMDLNPDHGQTSDLYFPPALPTDPMTGNPLVNALAMPVIDTGDEGFIFVSVDGSYNHPPFQNPIRFRFPDEDQLTNAIEGLKMNRMAVGLAGRKAYLAADPPGISTPVRPGLKPGDQVRLDATDPSPWLALPHSRHPAQPLAGFPGHPLDTVSDEPFKGHMEWDPVTDPRPPDLYVLRINWMTGAPLNDIFGPPADPITGTKPSIGGPASHCMWEIFVPADRTSVDLPAFPDDPALPARPVVANPAPSLDSTTTPQHYGPKTVELELNAYVLGAAKPFDYSDDFAYSDVNLSCSVVSQDSYLVTADM